MNSQSLFHRLPAGPKIPKEVNCLVEIPKGSTNKYEYDEEMGVFMLDRVLYEAVFFPTEYGIIPQTWNEKDGDPQDIMVVSSFPTFPGCIIACRPIGVLRMIDTNEQDNKIVAIASQDPRFEEIKELSDLPAHFKKEIGNFFENYAELQPDKKIKIEGWSGKDQAEEIIQRVVDSYQEKFASSS